MQEVKASRARLKELPLVGTLRCSDGFVGGGWGVPAAVWLAPVFALRFSRQTVSIWQVLFWLWLATAAASVIAAYHTTTLQFQSAWTEPALFTLMALPIVIPFPIDRIFHRRWAGDGAGAIWLSPVYPVSFVSIDYVSAIGSPLGSFGAMAYSQAGFTTFMQLDAVTGMSGIAFVICWFASIVNLVWEADFQWRRSRGRHRHPWRDPHCRLRLRVRATRLVEPSPDVVKVGGFSLPLNETGSMRDLWVRGAEEEYLEAFKDLNRRQLAKARTMAQAGAKIVVLWEVALQGFEDEVSAILESAAELVRDEGIYLVLPTGRIAPDGQYENVVRIFDPGGEVALEHYKYGGAAFEGSVPGSGELQLVETPYGKLSAVICWDADFPEIVRQAGAADVDLLFVPANDWCAIRDLHSAMATFRAVENGMPVFPQTGNGLSSVIHAHGRVLNRVDMHAERDPDAWGGVQMVDVPAVSVRTVYASTGDIFGLAMLIGYLGLVLLTVLDRKRNKEVILRERSYH